MVWASKLLVVDTVGMDEDNLGKGVKCSQLLGHEKVGMAENCFVGMKIECSVGLWSAHHLPSFCQNWQSSL